MRICCISLTLIRSLWSAIYPYCYRIYAVPPTGSTLRRTILRQLYGCSVDLDKKQQNTLHKKEALPASYMQSWYSWGGGAVVTLPRLWQQLHQQHDLKQKKTFQENSVLFLARHNLAFLKDHTCTDLSSTLLTSNGFQAFWFRDW
jgi:hypothetical protein